MNRHLKFYTIVLIISINTFANAQVIDNYGIKTGAGLSNEYWHYKRFTEFTRWYNNKVGFTAQVFAEKNFGKYLSAISGLGYIQKGFIDDITLTTETGEDISVKDNRVIMHDLSFDLSCKISPFLTHVKPYFLLGLRTDYLLDCRDVIFNYHGKDQEFNRSIYNYFNKFTLGGLIALGATYKNLVFIEFEYNPAITKNFESAGLAVNDRYLSLTLGLNIKQLVNGNSK